MHSSRGYHGRLTFRWLSLCMPSSLRPPPTPPTRSLHRRRPPLPPSARATLPFCRSATRRCVHAFVFSGHSNLELAPMTEIAMYAVRVAIVCRTHAAVAAGPLQDARRPVLCGEGPRHRRILPGEYSRLVRAWLPPLWQSRRRWRSAASALQTVRRRTSWRRSRISAAPPRWSRPSASATRLCAHACTHPPPSLACALVRTRPQQGAHSRALPIARTHTRLAPTGVAGVLRTPTGTPVGTHRPRRTESALDRPLCASPRRFPVRKFPPRKRRPVSYLSAA